MASPARFPLTGGEYVEYQARLDGHLPLTQRIRGAVGAGDIPQHRLYRYTNDHTMAGSAVELAGHGLDVDGVSWYVDQPDWLARPALGIPAIPGIAILVEAGGVFSAGAVLQSDANGRAIQRTTGVGVLRALQAASNAGDLVVAVFLSGR